MEVKKDIYKFHWDGLPSSSFSDFEGMKGRGEFCDVTIRVGDLSFPAHRIVLAAAVPYFRAMFRFNMTEEAVEEVTLKEIDPLALKSLIDFIYSNKLTITNANVHSLLATSMYLQLDSVTHACFGFLSKHFSSNNVVMARALADSVNKLKIVENADRYIREYFDEVSTTEEFLSLPFPYIKELISRDDINVTSEETVLEAVVKWVKTDTDRHIFLPDLLSCIRFPFVTPEYVAKRIATEELICASSPCVDILTEAIDYHLVGSSTPCSFSVRERYCERMHHLKCQKIMGCGMYTVSKTTDQKISLSYYDPLHDRWAAMYENEYFQLFNYLVCTESRIYFFHRTQIRIFNLKTLERTSLAYPEEFSPVEPGIALHGGKIYFVGGEGVSSDMVHCLNPQKNTCHTMGKMTANRISPSAASLGECIYIIGGFYDNETLSSAERYNAETGQSAEISPMLVTRCDYGCSALNGRIYVCGGVATDGNPSNVVQVYDPETDHWSFVPPMNAAMKSMSLVSYAGKLLAVEEVCTSDDVQIFDPDWNVWKSVKPIFRSCNVEELIVVVTNSTWKIKGF